MICGLLAAAILTTSQTIVVVAPQDSNELAAPAAITRPGSANDPVRSVQDLPGVAIGSMGIGGEIPVRGAAPEDTRTLLDGVPLPYTFHWGALRSVVPGDDLDSLLLLPGNYDVRHGDAIGALLLLNTPTTKPDFVHADAELIDSSLAGKEGLVQWSIRRSNLDAIFTGPVPRYEDAFVKVSGEHTYVEALAAKDDLVGASGIGSFALVTAGWSGDQWTALTAATTAQGLLGSSSTVGRAYGTRSAWIGPIYTSIGAEGSYTRQWNPVKPPGTKFKPLRDQGLLDTWVEGAYSNWIAGLRVDHQRLSPRVSYTTGPLQLSVGRYEQEPLVSLLGLTQFDLNLLGYHLPPEDAWQGSTELQLGGWRWSTWGRSLSTDELLVSSKGYQLLTREAGRAWGTSLSWSGRFGSVSWTEQRSQHLRDGAWRSYAYEQKRVVVGIVNAPIKNWLLGARARYAQGMQDPTRPDSSFTFFQLDARAQRNLGPVDVHVEVLNVTGHRNGRYSIPVIPSAGLELRL